MPRRAILRCGGEQAPEWLVRKEATLRLAQVCARGLPPNPEIGEFANWPGGLEALEAERPSDAGSDLSAIDHGINSTGVTAWNQRRQESLESAHHMGARVTLLSAVYIGSSLLTPRSEHLAKPPQLRAAHLAAAPSRVDHWN